MNIQTRVDVLRAQIVNLLGLIEVQQIVLSENEHRVVFSTEGCDTHRLKQMEVVYNRLLDKYNNGFTAKQHACGELVLEINNLRQERKGLMVVERFEIDGDMIADPYVYYKTLLAIVVQESMITEHLRRKLKHMWDVIGRNSQYGARANYPHSILLIDNKGK